MFERLENPDPEYVKAKAEEGIPEYSTERRYFGEDGKNWPLIQICIYKYPVMHDGRELATAHKGIKLSVNYKQDLESWWEEIPIPSELVGEAADMLLSYKT